MVYLAEDDNTGEFCLGVIGDGGSEVKYAYLAVRQWQPSVIGAERVRMSPPCLVGTSVWLSTISIVTRVRLWWWVKPVSDGRVRSQGDEVAGRLRC